MIKLVKPEVYDFANDEEVTALCESCNNCNWDICCDGAWYADADNQEEILF